MTQFALSLTLCSLSISCYAQSQKWLRPGDVNGDQYLLIHTDTIEIGEIEDIGMFTWATFSQFNDSAGEPLFYTNGFQVNNPALELMQNGDSVMQGEHLVQWGYTNGAGIHQGAVIVPNPGNNNQFYLFNLNLALWNEFGYLRPGRLDYHLIDMTYDGGLGAIILKNIPLVEDTMAQGKLTAVKHANGKDWWLISHEFNSNRFYKFLIDSIGIHGPYSQNIGSVAVIYDFTGQAIFSPEGDKYAQLMGEDTVDIIDFDRCTGEFSSCESIVLSDTLPNNFLNVLWGAFFSSNGRYLYAGRVFSYIYQFDTWADSVAESKVIVAEMDTSFHDGNFQQPLGFGNMLIGPDKRIYISGWSGFHYLHVIENPDSAGIACNVIQHAIQFPHWSGANFLSNTPFYDLGPQPIFQLQNLLDTTIAEGDVIQIGVTAISGLVYQWQPANGLSATNVAQPLASPIVTTTYTLTVTDTVTFTSCNVKMDTVTVTVIPKENELVIPTLLNSSVTDFFVIEHLPEGNHKLEVFNELGQQVYSDYSYNNDLDLKRLAAGLYLYRLTLEGGEVRKGTIVIVR